MMILHLLSLSIFLVTIVLCQGLCVLSFSARHNAPSGLSMFNFPVRLQPSRDHLVDNSRASALYSAKFDILKDAEVIDPSSGNKCKGLDGIIDANNPAQWMQNVLRRNDRKKLVVIMPQMGDFDSAEHAEMLAAIEKDLERCNIAIRIIAIGDENSAKLFAKFNNLNLKNIRIDPEGDLHKKLNLHSGPNWNIPSQIPKVILEWFADYVGAKDNDRDVYAIARAWLNYMAMCAGIEAPDTLQEIFRGYVGDKDAPERIRLDEKVIVGEKENPLIAITGVSKVQLGPLRYQQLWRNEKGYQRPVELATVRLRIMVEVLTKFDEYVPDQRFLDLRGATYLFDENNELIYEHVDTGVLSYSKTMARPLTFLEPFIGKKALNPLMLGDVNAQ